MKPIRVIEDKILELKSRKKEIASAYKMLSKVDADGWRGTSLELRYHRMDEAISMLTWVLDLESVNGGKSLQDK
jgi:hypothetical protein